MEHNIAQFILTLFTALGYGGMVSYRKVGG